MPARCVVLERLVKFNGEAHVDLTPGEYTQLTGRAGRRGIDVEGHAVVVWSPEVDPRHVAGLASTRTYPLRSSFRPSYNMAVNLVGTVGADARPRAAGVVVRAVPGRPVGGRPGPAGAAQRRRPSRRTAPRRAATTATSTSTSRCAWRSPTGSARWPGRAPRSAGPRRSTSLERLRVGDVIRVPSGRRAGLAVVLDPGAGGFGEPRPLVLTEDRWAGRVAAGRLHRAGRGAGPGPGAEALQPPLARPRAATWPRRSARTGLDRHAPAAGRPRPRPTARTRELAELRDAAAPAPLPRLPGARGARPLGRAAAPAAARHRGAARARSPAAPGRWPAPSTGSARCSPSAATSPATARSPTPAGCSARIWTEADLLVAECLRRGVWDGPGARTSWPAPSRWCCTRPGARRDERASVPRGPVADAIDATREALGRARGRRGGARPGADPRAGPRLRLADRTAGRAASRWRRCWPAATTSTATCRPATSSAGPGRWSTCSARSPTPPGRPPKLRDVGPAGDGGGQPGRAGVQRRRPRSLAWQTELAHPARNAKDPPRRAARYGIESGAKSAGGESWPRSTILSTGGSRPPSATHSPCSARYWV